MSDARVLSFPKGKPAAEYLVAVDYYVAPLLADSEQAVGLQQWTVRLRASNSEAAMNHGLAEFFDSQKALGACRGLEVVRVRTVQAGNMGSWRWKEPGR